MYRIGIPISVHVPTGLLPVRNRNRRVGAYAAAAFMHAALHETIQQMLAQGQIKLVGGIGVKPLAGIIQSLRKQA